MNNLQIGFCPEKFIFARKNPGLKSETWAANLNKYV
jgi:hypothetical protein